ncbi:hypothetical protein L873DRAFT_1780844 [Choiromyces venosus 120613-1]|uniref:Uncharacterized protein n=1 Tax=Choiromyces venosus 120613-1 TaxID=1336337 RepID=A0A3N4J2Y9_9PEZI|nr:hypothetical protein L873DRAFT_1780844 [Choiromyces venosus 120613-1]
MSPRAVATKLDLKKSTVEDILRKVKAQAADPGDFDDVLGCLEGCHEGGNPEKYAAGSEESIALRDLSQQDEEHWQRTIPEIAQELGIPTACSTLEQIFHSQHNIFQRKLAHKHSLSLEHLEARLAFAHMALQIAINTIVFMDEMWIEFNKPRCQRNISQYRGVDAHEYALHDYDNEKQPIQVMFWDAIILGEKGPYHIWEPDTVEEKGNYQQIVSEENQVQQERQQINQQQAHVPGTWQYKKLLTFNHNIDRINIEEGRTGRHKCK